MAIYVYTQNVVEFKTSAKVFRSKYCTHGCRKEKVTRAETEKWSFRFSRFNINERKTPTYLIVPTQEEGGNTSKILEMNPF